VVAIRVPGDVAVLADRQLGRPGARPTVHPGARPARVSRAAGHGGATPRVTTATIHGTEEDLLDHAELVSTLETRTGRLIFNGFPTGLEVCSALHHGGGYPASTHPFFTSVGTNAIYRFVRPVCFQGFPDAALPAELQEANPRGIQRMEDGAWAG